jgi:prepilin-type N-terminal cleavage/methylation domain-containing protein
MKRDRADRVRAFTLMEMLVVIGVIAILAGILVGALPSITGKRVRSRVTAEMTAIESVIEGYKQKKGFYPPGTNVTRPTLYYELTGQAITDPIVKTFFGLPPEGQIVNSGAEDSFNFYKNIPPSQIVKTNLSGNPNNTDPNREGTLFAVRTRAADGSDAAVWQYDSVSDTRHNHDSFDLWVDVMVNGKTNRIGNWRD